MRIRNILMASALAVSLQVSATDVYVYMSNNFVPITSLGNIRKIINGATETTLISTKGDTVTVENSSFTYITFHRTSLPVGIESAKAQNLKISYEGGSVKVTNSSVPKNISFISSDGSVFSSFTPTDSEVVISTAGIPAGVYIVKVVTSDGKKLTKKIIKK